MPRCYCLVVALLLQAAALLAAAPALAAPTHIAAELIASAPAAPGGTIQLALAFRPEPGWHGYWYNPGDAGVGMTLAWNAPSGSRIGPPRYPVPQTLVIAGLMNHVYEHDYAVLQSLTLPPDALPGSVLPVSVKAEWLACSAQLCVPEQADLSTAIRVIANGAASPPDPHFDLWNRQLPAPLGAPALFSLAGDKLRIGIPLPANQPLSGEHLFVGTEHAVDYAAAQDFRRQGDLLVVTLARPKFGAVAPSRIAGVLRFSGAGDGVAFVASPGLVTAGGVAVGAEHAPPGLSALPVLLLGALLGGLLLNIMPCVFPILSLKALSLMRAGESEAEARAEGLAYTAGVVIACVALGAVLLALRAAGNQVGWAFQLQEPWVVVVLAALAVAITANLAGLFEVAVPGFASAGSPQGAFATGLLAAFVATPCTGPFMAAAMGAALLLPPVPALALFAALGLGIALPFLGLAFIPALRRLLPRPGAWMGWFRKAMAVPMGLTALALLWLCWRLGGPIFAVGVAALSLSMLIILHHVGQLQRHGLSARLAVIGLVPLLVVAAIVLPMTFRTQRPGIESMLSSQPFSEAALARARTSAKPAFVYFTADWCLTCKVNERVAIERSATRRAFRKAGVQVLVGDWTRRDPAITRFLTAQGAAGVPLYLWYPAGGGSPQQLPQVLTEATLTSLAGS